MKRCPSTLLHWSIMMLFVAMVLPGCNRYGEVSSEVYDYAQALYSICNLRDQKRLEQLSERIETARQQADISDHEAEWLLDIILVAGKGEWETAGRSTRQLLEDQVRGR